MVGVTALRRRLQAAAARGLSPFVGRQPEMEALQQALAQAGAGQGQVVALLGEPGVGKSRLVYEFLHSHHTQGWRGWRVPRCRTARPPPTCRSVTCSKPTAHIEDRDDLRTVRAKVTGQILTLDDRSPGHPARAAGPVRSPAGRQSVADPGPLAAAAPHPGGPEARPAARKPGAAPAPGLRRPALDRQRDAGRARYAGREPADRPGAVAGQLPSGVSARLGQ